MAQQFEKCGNFQLRFPACEAFGLKLDDAVEHHLSLLPRPIGQLKYSCADVCAYAAVRVLNDNVYEFGVILWDTRSYKAIAELCVDGTREDCRRKFEDFAFSLLESDGEPLVISCDREQLFGDQWNMQYLPDHVQAIVDAGGESRGGCSQCTMLDIVLSCVLTRVRRVIIAVMKTRPRVKLGQALEPPAQENWGECSTTFQSPVLNSVDWIAARKVALGPGVPSAPAAPLSAAAVASGGGTGTEWWRRCATAAGSSQIVEVEINDSGLHNNLHTHCTHTATHSPPHCVLLVNKNPLIGSLKPYLLQTHNPIHTIVTAYTAICCSFFCCSC